MRTYDLVMIDGRRAAGTAAEVMRALRASAFDRGADDDAFARTLVARTKEMLGAELPWLGDTFEERCEGFVVALLSKGLASPAPAPRGGK